MVDQTVVARLKRQRELRSAEGWREVKVWVPTEQDAADIRKLAEERRAKAEALHGLSEEVPTVTPETEDRIARAIAEHGSAAYTTASGAVLDLMTQLTEEDDLLGFSRAVVVLARAKPANAGFVTEAVPAKITNFLIKHRRVDPSRLLNWTAQNRGWEDSLKSTVREPNRFVQIVEAMAEAINEQEDCFMVVADDGHTPLASISKENMIKFEATADGKMKIYFKVLGMPQKDRWESKEVTFRIEPANRHIPRILKGWGFLA